MSDPKQVYIQSDKNDIEHVQLPVFREKWEHTLAMNQNCPTCGLKAAVQTDEL